MDDYMSFKEFENRYAKRIDTWVERILCDKLATLIAYSLYVFLNKIRLLPYYVTIISFSLRLLTALLFFHGRYLQGAILYFLSMICDCTDGILSRAYFGRDPELRGTLDVAFDQIGLSIVLVSLGFRFYSVGSNELILYLLFYVTIVFLYEFSAATRFRIFSKLSLDPDCSMLDSVRLPQNVEQSRIVKYYLKFHNVFESRGMIFYPTIVDSEFLLFVVAPVLRFPLSIVVISLLVVAIEVIIGLSANIWSIINLKNM